MKEISKKQIWKKFHINYCLRMTIDTNLTIRLSEEVQNVPDYKGSENV